jgi:hypothetical protein
MKTYNLGKIELLRNPESQLKGIPSFSKGKINRGFTSIPGRDKKGIQGALDDLGFRLPTIKEAIHLYDFLEGIKEFEYRRLWVETHTGPGVLIIGIYGDSDFSIWENPPETLGHILFAVRDSIPS